MGATAHFNQHLAHYPTLGARRSKALGSILAVGGGLSMSVRSLLFSGAMALAIASLAPMRSAAQPAKGWTPAFTSDGHPDLQGNWMNKNATPLERPKQLEG